MVELNHHNRTLDTVVKSIVFTCSANPAKEGNVNMFFNFF